MALDALHAEVYSRYLVESLRKNLVYGNLVSRSPYEDEIKEKGSTLHIGSIGDVTIRDYNSSADITIENLTGADTVLTINQDKYFGFYMSQSDLAKMAAGRTEVLDSRMKQSLYNLLDTADSYIAAQLAADAGTVVDNSGSVYTVSTSNAYSLLLKLSKELSKKNVPKRDRWCVITPDYAELLKQDSAFGKSSDAVYQEVVKEGFIGRVDGMDIYESNNAPTTNSKRILAGHGMAGVYAESIMGIRADWDVRRMAEAVTGHHLYGFKVVMPAAVAVLRTDV